jgi:plastocyanin
VQVTAQEYSFTLSRAEVPAGQVIIELVNHGQDEHNLHAVEPSEGAEVGAIPDTPPSTPSQHSSPTLKLNLHHGSYTFFCSIKDHEAKGMKATLLVE